MQTGSTGNLTFWPPALPPEVIAPFRPAIDHVSWVISSAYDAVIHSPLAPVVHMVAVALSS